MSTTGLGSPPDSRRKCANFVKSAEYACREFSDSPFSIRQKSRNAVIGLGSASDIVPMIQYSRKCLKHSCCKEVTFGRVDNEESHHPALRQRSAGGLR